MAAHSTCQPGRPNPNVDSQAGSPGRVANQTSGSSASVLPGRPGSPPRTGDSLIIVWLSSPETAPKAGSADLQKYVSPSRSYSEFLLARTVLNSSISPTASTA